MTRVHEVRQHRSAVAGIEARTLVSNHHFPRHSHDQFGIGVIAAGAQKSWSGVGRVEAGAGDVIMVNPGEMHDGAPLYEGEPREWRMLYFDPPLVDLELKDEVDGPLEIVRPVASDSVLASEFARLFACLTTLRPDALAVEESLVGSLMRVVQRHAVSSGFSVISPCVKRAVDRIDSSPQSAVTLSELADLTGVNRFQLLRGFAREVGITPHAYVVQRRVRLARRLLAEGRDLVEIALEAGFSDQSHMSRQFVRQFGVTPSRYRAACA